MAVVPPRRERFRRPHWVGVNLRGFPAPVWRGVDPRVVIVSVGQEEARGVVVVSPTRKRCCVGQEGVPPPVESVFQRRRQVWFSSSTLSGVACGRCCGCCCDLPGQIRCFLRGFKMHIVCGFFKMRIVRFRCARRLLEHDFGAAGRVDCFIQHSFVVIISVMLCCARTHAHTCAHMRTRTRTLPHADTCTCVRVCTCARVAHTRAFLCTHAHMCTYAFACTRA